MLNEKEALEASLKALSVQQLEDRVEEGKSSGDVEGDEESDQEETLECSMEEGHHRPGSRGVSDNEQVKIVPHSFVPRIEL